MADPHGLVPTTFFSKLFAVGEDEGLIVANLAAGTTYEVSVLGADIIVAALPSATPSIADLGSGTPVFSGDHFWFSATSTRPQLRARKVVNGTEARVWLTGYSRANLAL